MVSINKLFRGLAAAWYLEIQLNPDTAYESNHCQSRYSLLCVSWTCTVLNFRENKKFQNRSYSTLKRQTWQTHKLRVACHRAISLSVVSQPIQSLKMQQCQTATHRTTNTQQHHDSTQCLMPQQHDESAHTLQPQLSIHSHHLWNTQWHIEFLPYEPALS